MKRKDDRAERYATANADYATADIRTREAFYKSVAEAKWYLERAFRAGAASERRKIRREAKAK